MLYQLAFDDIVQFGYGHYSDSRTLLSGEKDSKSHLETFKGRRYVLQTRDLYSELTFVKVRSLLKTVVTK